MASAITNSAVTVSACVEVLLMKNEVRLISFEKLLGKLVFLLDLPMS